MSGLILALVAPLQAVAETTNLRDAWQQASRAQFLDALHRVDRLAERPAAGPEARYTRALLLINSPPITDSRLDEASALLEGVAADNDSEPELAAGAAYYIARIAAVHRLQPNLEEAKRLYHQAWRQHPTTAWAEKAALKWLTLHLAGVGSAGLPGDRLRDGEDLAPTLRRGEVRKNYHLLMAEAWARLADDPARVLEHLLAAEAIGLAHPQTKADVYCAIGNNAQSLGRAAVAVEFYRKYLSEFRRDARRHMIQEAVERLEGAHR